MILASDTYKSAMENHRAEIIELLRADTPMKVALALEKEGWSREWACKAIADLEVNQNPSKLPQGHAINQRMREKLSQKAGIGAAILFIGGAISLVTLISALTGGGLVVIAYGAVIAGAIMLAKTYPQLKKYPDRKLPVYTPPRNPREHRPGEY